MQTMHTMKTIKTVDTNQFCECGKPATRVLCGDKICAKCYALDVQRAKHSQRIRANARFHRVSFAPAAEGGGYRVYGERIRAKFGLT